jgi:hypothetical protein
MDLLWLDGEPALHVVYTATRFGAAGFLEAQDVEQVWSAFLECWALKSIQFIYALRFSGILIKFRSFWHFFNYK